MEAKGVKKEFANVGINVIQEKQLTTTQVGTDNFVHEIEVQTEIPPQASPVTGSKMQIVKEMPVTRAPKISSEYESEKPQDNPGLNRLIKKGNHPATVIQKEPMNVPPPEEEAKIELAARKKKTLNIEDAGFQTYSPEIKKPEGGLRVPTVHRDLLGSSPHYFREDFYTLEKDRKKVITTQGARPEQSISSTHYRKANEFDVDIDNLGKIGEEEAPRATYQAVINYRDIDFESYEPEAAAPVTEFKVKQDVSERPIYEDDDEAARILTRKEDSNPSTSRKKQNPMDQKNAYIKELPEEVKMKTFQEEPEVAPFSDDIQNPERQSPDSEQWEKASKPAVELAYEQESWEKEEDSVQEKKIDNEEEVLEDDIDLDPDAFLQDIEDQEAEVEREKLALENVELEGYPIDDQFNEDVKESEDPEKEIRKAQASAPSKAATSENKPSDKLKNILKMNEKALEIIESDRKKKKKETEQKYAQKGYIAGPEEDNSREGDMHYANKDSEDNFE